MNRNLSVGDLLSNYKNSMKIANDALYPSYGDSWRNEIDIGPSDPEPGDVLFNEQELSPGVFQGGFEFVKDLQINPEIANRIIKGPRTPNTIRGIPHLDSNFIDQKIKNNWQMLEPPRPSGGPQLPDFVQGQGSEGFEVAGGPDYSGIPNNRDLMIKDIVDKYGKDDKGHYKDPTLLIQGLSAAAKV